MQENTNVQERPAVAGPRKSPFLAGFLSAIFPFGVGTFYNGETVKGLIYLIIFAGLVTLQGHTRTQPFAALILAGFYFFQIIDSVGAANRFNRRSLRGGQAEPEEEALTTEAVKSGSIFWGVLLIVVGAVLLLANFEVISYHAIFDLWPLVVIVIGGKLIFDYFSKSRG